MAKILVAEDDDGVRSFLCDALALFGHAVKDAHNGEVAWAILQRERFDLLLTDLQMPRLDGLSLLKRAHAHDPSLQIIVLTAHGAVGTAVEAMKSGALDYIEKPIAHLDALRLLVARAEERRALAHAALREQASDAAQELPLTYGAPAMRPAVDALRRVAATHSTVLLLGESGVGKEVAARALHRWSARSAGAFVAVNCAALAQTLIESELFGHEKGAFTGAETRRQGKIELAQGGTFFLDEVGELKADVQAKLLRVLETRTFERVGGHATIEADVRWVAATNRDLLAMVRDGSFREDLYHRLAVFPIHLPPLRERPEDIAPLAKTLLARIAGEVGRPELTLSEDALAYIARQPWHGNVRALRNALERAAILSDSATLSADPFRTAELAGGAPQAAPRYEDTSPASLEDVERAAIARALNSVGGNRRRTAELLGISQRALYDKIKRYDL
jgi:two-component system, NtrC family, response regulator AtoC